MVTKVESMGNGQIRTLVLILHSTIHNIDNLQGPPVQHRELTMLNIMIIINDNKYIFILSIRSDQSLSRVRLFVTLWTIIAHQAPLSMGFSRQEYWSGQPFLSPGESSQPRDRTWISCISGRFFTIWVIREAHFIQRLLLIIHFM